MTFIEFSLFHSQTTPPNFNRIVSQVDFRDTVNQFSIRCGEYNVKEEDEIYRSQESKVEEVILNFTPIAALPLSLSIVSNARFTSTLNTTRAQ